MGWMENEVLRMAFEGTVRVVLRAARATYRGVRDWFRWVNRNRAFILFGLTLVTILLAKVDRRGWSWSRLGLLAYMAAIAATLQLSSWGRRFRRL